MLPVDVFSIGGTLWTKPGPLAGARPTPAGSSPVQRSAGVTLNKHHGRAKGVRHGPTGTRDGDLAGILGVEWDRGFRFIDLFAGIGGIRLGFESAGGRCVFSSEWDGDAQDTYEANFGAGPTNLKCLQLETVSGPSAGWPDPSHCRGVSSFGLVTGNAGRGRSGRPSIGSRGKGTHGKARTQNARHAHG